MSYYSFSAHWGVQHHCHRQCSYSYSYHRSSLPTGNGSARIPHALALEQCVAGVLWMVFGTLSLVVHWSHLQPLQPCQFHLLILDHRVYGLVADYWRMGAARGWLTGNGFVADYWRMCAEGGWLTMAGLTTFYPDVLFAQRDKFSPFRLPQHFLSSSDQQYLQQIVLSSST
jgi:hypothetical protein